MPTSSWRALIAGAMVVGSLDGAAAQPATPTFSKDVAPILYKNCVACHRPGEMGPMSLITYNDARPWARSIREKVASREMPPWHADPSIGTFRNARSLNQKDIDTIVAWVDGGAPQGNLAEVPRLPAFADGWQVGKPDVVFEMPVSFEVPATGVIGYKSYNVPTNFTEDMWVIAAEVRVEDRRHVHHAVVTIQEPGGNQPLDALQVTMLPQQGRTTPLTSEEQARQKTGASRSASTEHRLAGYAVGQQPPVFPAGLAKRVPAGSVLNFSMHYTTNGEPGRDKTKIGLVLAREPPKGEIYMGLVNNGIFEIPPNTGNTQVESQGIFLEDVKIWALHPHMHVRGKDMTYTAIYPDGRREILMRVPKYRFDWQLDYYLAEPKALPKGTKILVTAHYDNTTGNKDNPDPSATVYYGDQTWDEMMAGYFTYTIDSGPMAKRTQIAAGALVNLRGASVPVPSITGPIAATTVGDAGRDYPFYAAVVDLKARGYVEEEFFIEGTAGRYKTGGEATGTLVDSGHPYKTRVVVRRPAAAARFNGTAIVEWNNVTAGHDLDIDWFQTHDHLMRSGYAWVGVTPQRIGVDAIKVWSPKRYGTLDVTHGGMVGNDDLSYDVFAQAGQAVRTGAGRLMGGLEVQRIFATGHSQSAGRLGTYVNSVHPLGTVFDAVILHGGGGRVRADLDIPVWKLLSETDVQNQAANRQPDTKMFRTWEVAGDSHVDLQFVTYSRQLSARDGSPVAPGFTSGGTRGSAPAPAATPVPSRGPGTSPCDRPPYSHIPFYQVFDAAIDHLVRWVKDGTPPPTAPPIEVSTVGPPAVMARDADGNALGGIRLSQHAVPTAVNTGVNSGPGFCRLNGSYDPFTPDKLASLYPAHAAYVAKVKDVTDKNLKAGYILKPEAEVSIAEAEKSAIGQR